MFESHSSTKVYFYCCPSGFADQQAYQHPLVCIAEGLQQLGIEFYSDVNYWHLTPDTEDYLFNHNPNITPDDCSIVIIDTEWVTNGKPLPEGLFKPNRNYLTAYFELHELTHSIKPEFRHFDCIFRGYYNKRFSYPSNVYPWAFGLSKRILRETQITPDFTDREKTIMVNFRHSQKYMHSVRKYVLNDFINRIEHLLKIDNSIDAPDAQLTNPYHYMQWVQTGKRHYSSYYKRLSQSVACACFGGFFVTPFPKKQRSPLSRLLKRLISKWGLRTNTVEQWDSWRFWEALAAGTVAFHIDLEKYGAVLPVMPTNWKHYIGIDFDNIDAAIARITAEPELLEKIAAAGREWVLEHYSPVPTALRFLATVGCPVPPECTSQSTEPSATSLNAASYSKEKEL